ncbi:sugar porter family MFS transporter [Niallia sp. MER 6]|uniref:sugar porter family MFS transporter n=1 Tax=Niallia sp. MER 6 TaxID=2939567 RepID=UPI00255A098E|nr:sugar porter family MFS transporter [Niallia sp. MER 6]
MTNIEMSEQIVQAKPPKQKDPKKFLKRITIVSTFGGLLFGYDTGVINGALPFMADKDQLNLSPFTEGLVASSLVLGAAFGSIFGGRLADKKGRRRVILYLAVLFFFSAAGCVIAPNTAVMVGFRFLLGLAVGGSSVVIPSYLAEMAPSDRRGMLVTQNELMIVTGQFLAYIFNALIGNIFGDTGHVWRYMLVIATLPAVALWIGVLILPESPRWLASRGRWAEALKILNKIRTESIAEQEMKEIKANLSAEQKHKKLGFRDLGTPWIRRIVWIGIVLGSVSQLVGINSIMYYGTQILENAGFGTKTALIANVANGLIAVIAVIVGMSLLNKVNRRPMLLTGLIGVTVALISIGTSAHFLEGSAMLPYIVLSMTVLYLAFFQGAIAPLVWLILAEIFPMRLRGIGMGLAVLFLWLCNFLVGLFFPVLLAGIGLSATFFLFALFAIIGVIFVAKAVPETRGLSLEEIEDNFKSKEFS